MKNSKFYWFVSYEKELISKYNISRDNQKIILSDEALEALDKEFSTLTKVFKKRIMEINYDNAYVIIEDKIPSGKTLDQHMQIRNLVPYVKLKPYQGICSVNGFPCISCEKHCNNWGNCKYQI